MKGVRRATRVVVITVVGTVLVLAGLVMLVTPGPGLVAIAAGLAVLAREFAWARRLLERIRVRLTTPRHRRADAHEAAVTDLDATDPSPDPAGPAAPHDQRYVA